MTSMMSEISVRSRLAILGLVLAGAALAQDAAAGEQSFNKCRPCHDVGADAKIKLGPPLNALDGRKAGSVEGFNYSDANKASGITWGKDTFMKYIDNPAALVPGTRMAFGGIGRRGHDHDSIGSSLAQCRYDPADQRKPVEG